ncbi:MAG: filamentous hemagglutinin N-terminal domain-containing protein [Gammaproteobacteria bacterium]|nr:filamentous hemagglutinin N-terminal domain-containing protein [Gammaproteobacteria bacterium]
MNRIHRVIWSHAKNAFVVVGEIARGADKSSTRRDDRRGPLSLSEIAAGHGSPPRSWRTRPLLAAILFALAAPSFAEPAVNALPTGGRIIAGAGTISTAGAAMTVRQDSDKLIANWQSFDIGSQASVTFQQPGASSVALNRVLGQDPSQILGHLNANGQVMLVNPAGIVFGQGSQVNVGGITATTLNITDADFLAGNHHFSDGDNAAAVRNLGHILADGGVVALVAPVVTNDGAIETPNGGAALAAGNDVTLDFSGDGLVSVTVTQGTLDRLIENRGAIRADHGLVILSAGSARDLLSGVVNNSGIVEARGLTEQGGRIILDGGAVSNTGTLDAGSAAHDGGAIDIDGHTVMMGGDVGADGANGGTIGIHSEGLLSLAGRVHATGLSGDGGAIDYRAGHILESTTGDTSADGQVDGGRIRVDGGARLASSGRYSADGAQGDGGRIDLSADDVRLFSARVSAAGGSNGGRVRIGGAFQGGKTLDATQNYFDSFVARWDDNAPIENAGKTFINDGSVIDVSGGAGKGGTAVVWSDTQTTFLGGIDATGATGGSVEISSAGELRQAALSGVKVGDGHLLLDPKDIVIGNAEVWAYAAIMGLAYGSGDDDVNVAALVANDNFGQSVSLNADGDRLAVGAIGDDGSNNATDSPGAVYLFSFTDSGFTGGALEAIVGKGYSGGKNVNVSALEATDQFGSAVSLNAAGDRLAVGAHQDDGSGNTTNGAGAVYLFSFSDASFTGGAQQAVVGKGYTGGKNVDVSALEGSDGFGGAVSLNAAGDRLAVGAIGDDGSGNAASGSGAVYLFSFTDSGFTGGALEATLGKGYSGGDNLDVSALETTDQFGSAVSINAAGDHLAVGAVGDDGSNEAVANRGAVYLFSFTDTGFSGGAQQAIVGWGYSGGNNVDVATLDGSDSFGGAVSLNAAGDRLAVGAPLDDGSGNAVANSGAVYLFSFTDTEFANGERIATLGKGYSGGSNVDVSALEANDRFGQSVSLDADGFRLAAGALLDDGSGNAAGGSGAVYLFLSTSNPTLGDGSSYGALIGQTVTVVAGDVADQISAGTNVTLQASNDITVDNAIAADNPSGNGGSLSLMAGRSILVNADISTDNGDVNLSANTPLSDGVVDADRDAGAAVVAIADGVDIDAGTGTVTIEVLDGAGKTHSDSGDITVDGTITAGQISLVNQGPSAGSGVVLGNNAALDAGGAGDALVIAGDTFTNNAGGSALTAVNGRWLVWSGDPADDDRGGLNHDFKQYNANYGSSTVLGSGDGFLYTLAPTISASITGAVTRVYDGTTDATVLAGDLTASGEVDGDSVTFAAPPAASYDDKNVATDKTVTATGVSIAGASNGAVTVYGYEMASTTATGDVGEVTVRTLTVGYTGVDRVYDGTTDATVTTSDDRVAGDNLSISETAAFDDRNVGTDKAIDVTGASLGGADAGNYVLAGTTGSATADITARTLGVNYIGQDKVYDGDTTATVLTTDDRVLGDVFTVSQSAAFNDKNVGTGKTIDVTGASLSGTDAGNYVLAGTTGSASADITPVAVAVSGITAADKDYDGNTDATVDTDTAVFTGMVLGDDLSVSATGIFDDKNVGTDKTVTLASSYGGADAGNYVFTDQADTTADITPKSLGLDLQGQGSREYDGTTVIDLSGVTPTLTGVVGSDTVSLDTGSVTGFTDKNVGTGKAITFTGFDLLGADAGNYSLVSGSAGSSADITPRAVTVSGITADDKIYDGNADATVDASGAIFANLVLGDDLTVDATGAFADKNVATGKTVTLSSTYDGDDAGNYTITDQASTTADITARTLNVGYTGVDRVYDGTTDATVTTGDDRVSGDALTIDRTAAFIDKSVGAGKTVNVSGVSLSGTDAGNYILASTTGATTADITARTLNVGYTGVDRVYDGTTDATVTTGDDRVSGDVLSIDRTAAFTDKNVAAGKTVNVSGVSLSGADAGNYILASTTGATTADITARTLNVGYTGVDRVYDGTTAATVTTNDDRVSGDVLTIGRTATFADRNVGTAKAVSVTGANLSGTDAGNYVLASTTGATTADISPAALVITTTDVSKVYDRTTTASGTVILTGGTQLFGSDTLSGGTFAFDDRNAGTGKTVTVSGVSVNDGNGGNNYDLSYQDNTNGTITPKELTLAGLTALDKNYDGNTTATIDSYGALNGVIAGDNVSLDEDNAGASFADPNPGIGKTVTVAGLQLAGVDDDNYFIATEMTTTADINSTENPPVIPPAEPGAGMDAMEGGDAVNGGAAGVQGGGNDPFNPPALFDLGADADGSAQTPRFMFDTNGDMAILVFGAGGASDGSVESTIPLFRQEGETMIPVEQFVVTQQGGHGTAAPTGMSPLSVPDVAGEADLRTVTAPVDLPDGSVGHLKVSVTPDGVLVVSVPAAIRRIYDEKQVLLLAVAIAKQRFGVGLDAITAVVFREEV